jgi:hypothetical protein
VLDSRGEKVLSSTRSPDRDALLHVTASIQIKIMKTPIPPAKKTASAAWAPLAALTGLLLALPCAMQAQFDDFNDGNADGWTPYAPLANLGVPAYFTFPNGGYRIETRNVTGSSQNPGRAGSFRQDLYENFYVAVDLVKWKDDTRQAFGVLARVSNVGLGTTIGYSFTYERGSGPTATSGAVDISRLDGEVPSGIQDTSSTSIHLDTNKTYRMVFLGKGSALEGRIYELPNTTTPLIVIQANDGTYGGGYCGLVIYDNTGGNGVADATFDNYLAAAQEPPRLSLWLMPETQEVMLAWPVEISSFRLESSPTLPAAAGDWTSLGYGNDLGNGYRGVLDNAAWGNKFYRLVTP